MRILCMYCCLLICHSDQAVAQMSKSDRDTVQMLLAAQQAAASAFPTGRMSARVKDDNSGRELRVMACWKSRNYYCEGKGQEVVNDKNGKKVSRRREMIQIDHSGGSEFYNVDQQLLQRVTDGRMSGWSQMLLRPIDAWFHLTPESEITWSAKLKQSLAKNPPFETSVKHLKDGRIAVQFLEPQPAGAFRIIFSMKHGGNVVEYGNAEPLGDAIQVRIRGSYEWEPVSGNRFRLKKYVYEQTAAEDESFEKCGKYVLDIDKFEAAPTIPRNRFTMASLNLPPGTRVQELGANERRYRIGPKGDPEVGVTEEQFRALVDQLKGTEFGRKRPN